MPNLADNEDAKPSFQAGVGFRLLAASLAFIEILSASP
jgi:hypothetical protein